MSELPTLEQEFILSGQANLEVKPIAILGNGSALAAQASGRTIDTIEGLSDSGKLAPLQAEFIARNAAQCGFCSSGMLLTAYELICSGQKLSRIEIRQAMSGNMCRCTGYHAIIDAVEAVMAKGQS